MLENLYPNSCYSVEFNRGWTRILNRETPNWISEQNIIASSFGYTSSLNSFHNRVKAENIIPRGTVNATDTKSATRYC